MRVFKFGGASVKDADAVRNVAAVLKAHQGQKLLVVISAMGKMTNKMEELAYAYFHSKKEKHAIMKEVRAFHENIVTELISGENEFYEVDNLLVELECMIEKKRNSTVDFDEEYDRIVPFGELLSTKIVSIYLQKSGFKNRWIDARNFILTTSQHRSAKVVWDDTVPIVKSGLGRLVEKQTIITQGFIGRDAKHKTTTLGREGSDYSAAIFAYALDAKDVTIWKDVDGVMNADPKRFDQAVLIPELSYNEAIELAYYGASVIHPKTIQPLKNKKIPLFVRSFTNFKAPGTRVIENESRSLNDQACYIVKDNQMLVTIATNDFSFIVEDNLQVIFGAVHLAGIQLNMMQNTAISFMACFNDSEDKYQRFAEGLNGNFNLSVKRGLKLFTIFNFKNNDVMAQKVREEHAVVLEQKTNRAMQWVIEPKKPEA